MLYGERSNHLSIISHSSSFIFSVLLHSISLFFHRNLFDTNSRSSAFNVGTDVCFDEHTSFHSSDNYLSPLLSLLHSTAPLPNDPYILVSTSMHQMAENTCTCECKIFFGCSSIALSSILTDFAYKFPTSLSLSRFISVMKRRGISSFYGLLSYSLNDVTRICSYRLLSCDIIGHFELLSACSLVLVGNLQVVILLSLYDYIKSLVCHDERR